jgi:hypothetical protein
MLLSRLLIASTCVLTALAHAQVRSIPDDAKRGEIRHVQEAIVSIDGVQQRLAPGAQIRDQDNRLLVPTALPPRAQVRYLLNNEGLVRQVWILTPAEAKRQAVKKDAAKN